MKLDNNSKQFHVGVYAICTDKERILLIKKARGPYKGTYDLPGGAIEHGESAIKALKRELMEETNSTIKSLVFHDFNEYFTEYVGSTGIKRSMHHLGLYFIAHIESDHLKTSGDGEDSLGAEMIEISNLQNIQIAPISKPVIEEIIDLRKSNKLIN